MGDAASATLAPGSSSPRTVRVRVRGGYEPAVLRASVGEALRIVFSREETASCSERVLFPAFGKSAMLPPFEDVALELVPERAGEYEFTCQLGVLRGRLLVAPEPDRRTRPDPASLVPARPLGPGGPSGEPSDAAFLTVVVWLCSAPFLLLLAAMFVGWRLAAAIAIAWFGVVASVCFALCTRRLSLPFRRTLGRARVPGRS